MDRLNDVKIFLNTAGNVENDAHDFVEALLDRHTDVQHGKFDRGRRKLPWIERKSDRYELTLSQVGEISGEPTNLEDIRSHDYRVAVTSNFIAAGNGNPA